MKNKKILYISITLIILLFVGKLSYDYLSKVNKETQKDISIDNDIPTNFDVAPNFTAFDKDGNLVSLSDYKGKKNVVVNFWASWCNPCKVEMPFFQEATNKYNNSDSDIEILMVNLTDGFQETEDKANKFLKDNNYNMNVLYDLDSSASKAYYISAIPRTIFVTKNGDLLYDHIGLMDSDALNKGINDLLNSK